MLRNVWRNIKSTLSLTSDFFGIVYGGGVAAPILIGIVTAILKFLGIKTISLIWFALIALLVLEASVNLYRFIMWRASERKKAQRMSNPYIFFKTTESEAEITKTKGCIRKDKLVIQSLKNGVNHYKFQFGKTLAKKVKIDVTKGGTISKSDYCAKATEYRVVFSNDLNKGDEKEIGLRYEAGSLINAPFLSHAFGAKFGSLKIKIIFPRKIVQKKIAIYRKDILTNNLVGDVEYLDVENHPTDSNKVQVEWEIKEGAKYQPEAELDYIMAWKWK